MHEGGNGEKPDELLKKKKEKDEKNFYMDYRRNFETFIGSLGLPFYHNGNDDNDRLQYFYYYDVLEAFSRHLFRCLIEHERIQLDEKKLKKK